MLYTLYVHVYIPKYILRFLQPKLRLRGHQGHRHPAGRRTIQRGRRVTTATPDRCLVGVYSFNILQMLYSVNSSVDDLVKFMLNFYLNN